MLISLAVVLPSGLTYLLWCYTGLPLWQGAAVCTMFGFYLASTLVGPHIASARTRSRTSYPDFTHEEIEPNLYVY